MNIPLILSLGIICFLCKTTVQEPLAYVETNNPFMQEQPELLQTVRLMEDGIITGVYSNDKIRYKGTVKRKKLHGSWESRFVDDQLFEQGSFIRGIPEGEWKIWHANGRLRYVRVYSADKWEQLQQQWIRPHPKFILQPLGEMHRKDPQTAAQFLAQNITFPNYGNYITYQPFFSEGLLHGPYVNFSEGGKALDSGHYAYGLRHGIWKESIRNSELSWSGHYQNGYREGNWKCVRPNNQIASMVFYQKGKVIWRKDYP